MVHLIKPNGHKKNTAADLEIGEFWGTPSFSICSISSYIHASFLAVGHFLYKRKYRAKLQMYAKTEKGKKWEDVILPVKGSCVDGTFPPGNHKISQ